LKLGIIRGQADRQIMGLPIGQVSGDDLRLPLTELRQRRVYFPVPDVWEGIVRRLAMPDDKQVHKVITSFNIG